MVQFITDFADLAVTLPVVALVCVALTAQHAVQQAVMLAVATGTTLALVVAFKLAVFVVSAHHANVSLQSPSGHTAGAIIVYGGLLRLLGPRRWRVVGPVLVASVVAFTRVDLGFHTVADVCAGAVTGSVGLLLLGWLLERPQFLPTAPPRRAVTVAVAAVAMMVTHGHHISGEHTLRRLATALERLPMAMAEPMAAGNHADA